MPAAAAWPEWMKAFGDPRDPDVDPIDWIERIPFTETRQYVIKIMEALAALPLPAGGTEAGAAARYRTSIAAGGAPTPKRSEAGKIRVRSGPAWRLVGLLLSQLC